MLQVLLNDQAASGRAPQKLKASHTKKQHKSSITAIDCIDSRTASAPPPVRRLSIKGSLEVHTRTMVGSHSGQDLDCHTLQQKYR